MTGQPHPKPGTGRQIIDPGAVLRAKLAHPDCAACGEPGGNGHHVLPKDHGGDDVDANIVCLCGSGTMRCHGAHHGSPYTESLFRVLRRSARAIKTECYTERRDAEWVNRRVGQHLLEHRRDVIDYVLGKLGEVAGADYLRRVYYIEDCVVH